MMLDSSAACADQAYEVFLFMNPQGMYQVPTLNDHTAKTFMHSYRPFPQSEWNAGMGTGMASGNTMGGNAAMNRTM